MSSSKETPCDILHDDGHYHCPYQDTYGGSESSMCRDCCGLGADENEPEQEEYEEEYDIESVDSYNPYFCENCKKCENYGNPDFDPLKCLCCGTEVGGVVIDNFVARADAEMEYTHRILRVCPMCGRFHALLLKKDEVDAVEKYRDSGELIQNALPGFNPGEREFVKMGYCADCQSMLFGNRILAESPRYK